MDSASFPRGWHPPRAPVIARSTIRRAVACSCSAATTESRGSRISGGFRCRGPLAWTQITTPGGAPPLRYAHASVCDVAHQSTDRALAGSGTACGSPTCGPTTFRARPAGPRSPRREPHRPRASRRPRSTTAPTIACWSSVDTTARDRRTPGRCRSVDHRHGRGSRRRSRSVRAAAPCRRLRRRTQPAGDVRRSGHVDRGLPRGRVGARPRRQSGLSEPRRPGSPTASPAPLGHCRQPARPRVDIRGIRVRDLLQRRPGSAVDERGRVAADCDRRYAAAAAVRAHGHLRPATGSDDRLRRFQPALFIQRCLGALARRCPDLDAALAGWARRPIRGSVHSAIYDPVREPDGGVPGNRRNRLPAGRRSVGALALRHSHVDAAAVRSSAVVRLRRSAAIYDPIRDQMVLFGGVAGPSGPYPIDYAIAPFR